MVGLYGVNKMSDLTEQWKKGGLKEGWYYINDSQIDYKYSKYSSVDFFITPHEDIKEVLAPVPSYDEWQKVLNIAFNNEVLRLENAKLKELLKECRYKIIADLDNARLCESSVDIEDFEYLLTRIDNAIGGKELFDVKD